MLAIATACCPCGKQVDGDVDENGATFAENAVIKAPAVRDATGYAAWPTTAA